MSQRILEVSVLRVLTTVTQREQEGTFVLEIHHRGGPRDKGITTEYFIVLALYQDKGRALVVAQLVELNSRETVSGAAVQQFKEGLLPDPVVEETQLRVVDRECVCGIDIETGLLWSEELG